MFMLYVFICLVWSVLIRTTIIAIGSFLDAFQKVADIATGTRGESEILTFRLVLLSMCARVCVCARASVKSVDTPSHLNFFLYFRTITPTFWIKLSSVSFPGLVHMCTSFIVALDGFCDCTLH